MANGILVCWCHHDVVHKRGIRIHRRGSRWVFTDAAGNAMLDPCTEGDDRAE